MVAEESKVDPEEKYFFSTDLILKGDSLKDLEVNHPGSKKNFKKRVARIENPSFE